MYTYENLRYALLNYWQFCSEVAPTTWREAFDELVHYGELLHAREKRGQAAVYWHSMPQVEQSVTLAKLVHDMYMAETQGVKYRKPYKHDSARATH